jgi:hypothetical protein
LHLCTVLPSFMNNVELGLAKGSAGDRGIPR